MISGHSTDATVACASAAPASDSATPGACLRISSSAVCRSTELRFSSWYAERLLSAQSWWFSPVSW